MDKQKRLQKIAREIENCEECKKDKIGKAVPGEGNPDTEVVFLGEAPGRNEAETGRPFVGRAGKLLRLNINNIGLKEEDVFITSAVKYLPKRGTPTPRDVIHGKEHLMKQIEIVNPKLIVLLGRIAVSAIFDKEKILMSKSHGSVIERNGRKYFLTYHPSAGLRFPPLKKLFEEDFKKLNELLNDK